MAKVKYYAKENSSIGTHSFYAVPIPNGTLTFDELLDEAMDGKSVEPSIAKACVTLADVGTLRFSSSSGAHGEPTASSVARKRMAAFSTARRSRNIHVGGSKFFTLHSSLQNPSPTARSRLTFELSRQTGLRRKPKGNISPCILASLR